MHFNDYDHFNFSNIVGKTFKSIINEGNDELIFIENDGTKYVMYHAQDCCEDVRIEDICGDLSDLENSPILTAEETSNQKDINFHSETWTFYKISTIKGSVTIRWYGESNGYYSEKVDFVKIVK